MAAARFIIGTVALALLTAVATLALWAVGYPMVRGWSPVAVVSGSMAPAIDSGDILVAAPVDDDRLVPGAVIVFDDPSGRGYVTHRIVGETDEGQLVTRGDANAEADSSRVDRSDIRGIGRLIIPFVGLPHSWVANGQWAELIFALVVFGAAVWASRWGVMDRYDPWPAHPRAAADVEGDHEWLAPALTSVVLAAGLVGLATGAQAEFVDPSDSDANSVTAASTFP